MQPTHGDRERPQRSLVRYGTHSYNPRLPYHVTVVRAKSRIAKNATPETQYRRIAYQKACRCALRLSQTARDNKLDNPGEKLHTSHKMVQNVLRCTYISNITHLCLTLGCRGQDGGCHLFSVLMWQAAATPEPGSNKATVPASMHATVPVAPHMLQKDFHNMGPD